MKIQTPSPVLEKAHEDTINEIVKQMGHKWVSGFGTLAAVEEEIKRIAPIIAIDIAKKMNIKYLEARINRPKEINIAFMEPGFGTMRKYALITELVARIVAFVAVRLPEELTDEDRMPVI